MSSRRSPFIKNDNVTSLETRIDYEFKNALLLREALTHPSIGHETRARDFDNQRLEFLGDAVLQLVITEDLYGRLSEQNEGCLTQLRSRLVSRDALYGRAVALDLGRHLLMGRGEEATGGRTRNSTLADAFEALIGAIYLDSDLATARKFILQEMREELESVIEEPVDVNPKGQLQELLQGLSGSSPIYEALSEAGPEHEKTFIVEVSWDGIALGQGAGRSKKQAETEAAAVALEAKLWETMKSAPEARSRRASARD